MKNKNYIAYAVLVVAVLIAGFLGVQYPMPVAPDDIIQVMGEGDTNFTNVVASGDVTAGDDIIAGDALTSDNLTVTGDTAFGDAAGDTCTVMGDMTLQGARDATTGYDYFQTIEGYLTGIVGGAKTYGLYIDVGRPAGYEATSGDLDDAGIKVRVETEAITTTSGTTLRGVDAEAKADNPDGTVTNLYGGSFTAKSDTNAGDVEVMVALQTNAQCNAAVNDYMAAADFRLFRQAATEPTEEYVVEVRNSSTTGTGADAAIFINSDGSGGTDDFNYGIDMASADIDTADIRFTNGTELEENTDTVLTFSEFLAAEEQTAEVVTAGSTIVATGTYQPITSASAVTTSASTAIADGVVNGQLLILVNENVTDAIIIKNGANTHFSGDITLGNDDTLTLMWDGADWLELATSNNS